MGIGKWLVGAACGVGAVIAAPVALPAMGMALAGSTLAGTTATAVGLSVAAASTTTLAVGGGVAATVAGSAVASVCEKKIEEEKDAQFNRGLHARDKANEQKIEALKRDNAAKTKSNEILKKENNGLKKENEELFEELMNS